MTSPTFTLIHEYAGRAIEPESQSENLGGVVLLYHLDLYRIEDQRQLETLGMEDLITPQSLMLIEWGEKFPSVIALSDGEIAIETLAGDERRITLTLRSNQVSANSQNAEILRSAQDGRHREGHPTSMENCSRSP